MPLRQTDERPLHGVHAQVGGCSSSESGGRVYPADPSESVCLLSVLQNPLWRACDLVPFAATVALHRE